MTGNRKTSITKSFLYTMIVITILSNLSLGAFWIVSEYLRSARESRVLKTRYIDEQKSLLQTEMSRLLGFIEYRKSRTETLLKQVISQRTNEAHAIAMNIYIENKDIKGKDDIQKMIRDALRPIRFNQGRGYFFATDFDGVEQLFAVKPELEGRNLTETRDDQGRYVIKDMIEIARKNHAGFYRYNWSKPGMEGMNFPKLAFVKHFEPYDWLIGTGDYLDEAQKDTQKNVLETIENTNITPDRFILVGRLNGDMLNGPNKGRNLYDLIGPAKDNNIRNLLELSDKNRGYLRSDLSRILGRKETLTVHYLEKIEDWDWFILVGAYIDKAGDIIALKQKEIEAVARNQIIETIIILSILIFLVAIIAKVFSRKTKKSFETFLVFFNKTATTFTEIDPQKVYFSEFLTLTESANKMAGDRKAMEKERENLILELESRVKQLNCLYGASELLSLSGEKNEDIPKQIAGLLAHSLGNSQLSAARISIEGRSYQSPGWRASPWMLQADLVDDRKTIGAIEVAFFEEATARTASLEEKRNLLDSLAKMISSHISRKKAETALLESESHHRTIFEKSPFGMVRFGKDGSVMDCNEMFAKLMGTPREQLLGFNAAQNLENEQMKNAVIKALSGKTSEFEGEYTSLIGRKTNYLRIVYNPMEPNRSPTEVIAAVEDITDRRQAEESLKNKLEEVAQARLAMLNIMEDLGEARQEAEAATRAKSDFLANMSHEIRTPMNAIIGMTHLAMRTDLTRKQQDYLKKIEIAAHSLLGVINDILDFSKIEAGKLDMEAIDFDLEEVMDHLSNLVTIKAQEKGLEFLIDMGVDIPMDLLGDPLRLGQVLINLTNNAVKFTEKGEIVVLVELMETYQERVKLKFSIRDSGIGMTQEQVDKLFTAFTQADTSTTRKYGGTGLGLTITKRLVEMMEGEIWVESEFGRGSRFSFTAVFRCIKGKSRERFDSVAEIKGMRVLVVDDNATSRQILEDLLESMDFDVTLAASGQEGLAELEMANDSDRPFELVLMDWKMPGMDGIEAGQKIKDHRHLSNTPTIIMVTAYGRDGITEQAADAGFDGFLDKPVSQSSLLDVIMEVMHLRDGAKTRIKKKGEREIEGIQSIRGARVLLAEDNEINQQVAREILEMAGLAVTIANDGMEAVQAVQNEDYDVVLMDIQMPKLDGFEATHKIRQWADQNPDRSMEKLPIIAMTAHAMSGDREKSIEAGMNDHVTKPIDTEELFSALVKWIQPVDRGDRVESETAPPVETDDDLRLPDLEGLDTKVGLNRVGGNRKLYLKILSQFHDNYALTANDIQYALNAGDRKTAERLVHTIKGVSGNIGATALYKAAAELETVIKNSDVPHQDDRMEPFRDHLNRVVKSLALVVSAPKTAGRETEESVAEPAVLMEILEKLAPAVEKRLPKQCGPIIEEMAGLTWPRNLREDFKNLVKMLNKYKYRDAHGILTVLMNKIRDLPATVEQKPDREATPIPVLLAALEKLAPVLAARKPKQYLPLIQEIKALAWPGDLKPDTEAMEKAIEKYRFKDAERHLGSLLEKLKSHPPANDLNNRYTEPVETA